MAGFVGVAVGEDEQDDRSKAVDQYRAAMTAVRPLLRVLEENNMACVRCANEHSCPFAYDLYNFDEEPMVSCIAMK